MNNKDAGNIIHMGNGNLWFTIVKELDGNKFEVRYTLKFTEIEETDLVCILDAIFSNRNVSLSHLKTCTLTKSTELKKE